MEGKSPLCYDAGLRWLGKTGFDGDVLLMAKSDGGLGRVWLLHRALCGGKSKLHEGLLYFNVGSRRHSEHAMNDLSGSPPNAGPAVSSANECEYRRHAPVLS